MAEINMLAVWRWNDCNIKRVLTLRSKSVLICKCSKWNRTL